MTALRTISVVSATLIHVHLLLGQFPLDGKKTKESLTELSLKGSELKLPPPLVGQIDQKPSFSREMLRIEWRMKDPVDLFVVVPKKAAELKTASTSVEAAKKPPVILYIYNYTKTTDRFMHDRVCQFLSDGNVAAVGFPTALSVTRFRNRPLTEWFVSDLQEALAESVHDVQMVINYLETRQDIDTSRIGVFGEGSGAAIAVLAAANDPRIKALDLEDSWGAWPTWLATSSIIPENERSNYLTPAFLKSVAGLDPIDYLPKLNIPVRLQYSREKSAVPLAVRKKLEDALPASAAHTPVDVTFDWLKGKLNGHAGTEEIVTASTPNPK